MDDVERKRLVYGHVQRMAERLPKQAKEWMLVEERTSPKQHEKRE